MITQKELLNSALVRRLIVRRFEGVGSTIAYRERYGRLPLVDKEGLVTGENDNGALFIRLGLVFADADGQRIKPTRWGELTQNYINDIVDNAIKGEKATLLEKRGYSYKVLLSNEFFPRVALQIVRALNNDGKLKITLETGVELSETHIVTSYLPPTLPGEEIKYSCRTEMASYLAVCGSFIEHYYNLAESSLRFLSHQGFRKYLSGSREAITDNRGQVLVPTAVVHAHNSRMIERSVTGPITYLGKRGRFGEFAMITFEEGYKVLEELQAFGKKGIDYMQARLLLRTNLPNMFV